MPSNCIKCNNVIKRSQDGKISILNCCKCNGIYHLAYLNKSGDADINKLLLQNLHCETCSTGMCDFSSTLDKI